ncbi:MAG: tetratricopeptide repeat protein [Spirochaetota bacterium]
MRSRLRRLAAAALFAFAALSLLAQQTDAPRLADEAARALDRGRYFDAVESYREALDLNPNYLEAVVGLAESYYWLEEYDQAQTFIDRALELARTDPGVINLAGRIAIGRGDLAAAEDAFARVLGREPNNVEAIIGRAELALARGRSVEAAGRLERALRLNPDQRKALLSLVLVYEHMGEQDIAREYLELARTVHRDRPEVHVLAAEYFLRAGQVGEAGRAARTAQTIDPQNRAAAAIRAEVALADESFVEARTIAVELIGYDRNDVFAWYVRALSAYRLGDLETSLESIRTALRIRPDDEVLRIWAEWLATNELELEHPVRAELAADRASDAATLARDFRFTRAMQAYRRGLLLTPLDLEMRRSYAELFRRQGYNASYLQELEVLRENGVDTTELARTIEVYRNALDSSVASRWSIDQFTLSRTRLRVGLYLTGPVSDRYPQSGEPILRFLQRSLAGRERIDIVDSARVDGYARAFGRARSASVDFYLSVRAALTDRMTMIATEISVARTGESASLRSSVRSGPDHAATAADAFADEIAAALPTVGRIVRREADRVVVDLGARDGVAAQTRFDVVRPDAATVAAAEARYEYPDEAVVGTVTITAVDDLVAEGTLETVGIVDMVTTGDLVLLPPEESDEDGQPRRNDLFPVLYQRVRRLR